jgi:hypothetical protein
MVMAHDGEPHDVVIDSQESLLGRWTNDAGRAAIRQPKSRGGVYIDYRSHDFGVRDPEVHIWSVGTYRPQAT